LTLPTIDNFPDFLSLGDIFLPMKAIELKTVLMHRIAGINDVSFLRELKVIIDSRAETDIIQLNQKQLDDIIASKKDIEKGSYIENSILEKEVRQWLKAR
jgi:hypothetical protein